ncbi:hypothetical protein MNBD_NITROSPIRAE01-1747 [hydrothermal vent metagenome]|uniref:RiboL-PSP-HEPN domain-containing protein n=1 Tax=hydrothermal vent metagenome TaxID=652676 RepID=A0A3B1C705_9ZZZZ
MAHWWGSSRMFTLPWIAVNGVHKVINREDESIDSIWAEYLKFNAFNGALWKLSENSYCSIYYAYENLVVNLLSKISGCPVRVTDRNFFSTFVSHFDESTVGKVWGSPKVSLAKEVRNSIVHNGGKATEKLLKLKYSGLVEDGEVFISASVTRCLYDDLKPLVNIVINEAVYSKSS